jgi:membrane fusion protein (multidrug efflux system)
MADVATENLAKEPKETETPRRRLPRKSRSRLVRIIVLLVVLLVLAAGAYAAWKYFGAYESTDDAQIDGHINAISARINGYVAEVLVDDQQYVKAGDVLVRIDPKDFSVALANAEADLAAVEATLVSSRTDVPITSTTVDSQLKTARWGRLDADAVLAGAQRQMSAAEARVETARAQVREAEATYKKNADDVTRYKMLAAKDEIPQQQYDTAVSTADAARATVDARRAAVAEAEQNIRVAQSAIEQANAKIAQADASIQSAMTAPQQVATQPGARQVRRGPGSTAKGSGRTGQAQPELLHHRCPRQRHRWQEDNRGRIECFARPADDGGRSSG